MPHKFIQTVTLGFIFSAMTLISACHHDDPLTMVSKKQAGKFLLEADIYAEKQLKPNRADLGDYAGCIQGKILDERYCRDLYKQMVAYAKTQPAPFNALSVGDLTNQKTWSVLDEYYQEAIMNHIPEH